MTGNTPRVKAPRAVLFDFGGVLATEGFREGLQETARRQGLDPREVHMTGMDAIYDSGYIVGKGSPLSLPMWLPALAFSPMKRSSWMICPLMSSGQWTKVCRGFFSRMRRIFWRRWKSCSLS